jgi:hypothetical protein
VGDYGTSGIRYEGDGELSGLARCIDDGMLGVAGVWRIRKRGNSYGFDCSNLVLTTGTLLHHSKRGARYPRSKRDAVHNHVFGLATRGRLIRDSYYPTRQSRREQLHTSSKIHEAASFLHDP